ncbi:MAG: hypothetical protein AB7N91_17495 [Candidatus Tectimicrobiota bacterium]
MRYASCVLSVWLCLLVGAIQASACPDLATAPHSQWKVEAQEGVWWFITPCGERFFSLGVNVVNGGYPSRQHEGRLSYHWPTYYPDLAHWAATTRQRLRDWGFNTVGAWSLDVTHLPAPFIPELALGRLTRFHWYDPFRPSMEAEMRQWAQQLVAPYKGNPYRIGYFPDNEIGWWYHALFLYYLKVPAANHTKQRLVHLLREHYHDDWAQFRRDFVPPQEVTSFAQLLAHEGQYTRLQVGGAGLRLIRRWTSVVAEHYYRLVHRALRDADPQALIFTDRLQIHYDPDAIRMAVPYVDVIATNYDVDGKAGELAQYYFAGLQQLTQGKPVLVSEWFFAAQENRTGNRNAGHLMTVQTQAERARGASAAARALAQLPHLVGLHWFQYYDHPVGGRSDGEDYNFGLVDIHDQPYEELTQAFRQTNPQLAVLHQQARSAATPPAAPALLIPQASINLQDHALDDWPRAQALLPGLQAPAGDVVFGDFLLAWDQANLYLGVVSMDSYDPAMLMYPDAFPLVEALQFAWGIDAGTGAQRFTLYVVPPREYAQDSSWRTRVHFCRNLEAACLAVPEALASYSGKDTPRTTAEVALPWSAFGLAGPPPTGTLRLELAATAFHRARWMSWSGQPPAVGLHEPASWRTVQLGPR